MNINKNKGIHLHRDICNIYKIKEIDKLSIYLNKKYNMKNFQIFIHGPNNFKKNKNMMKLFNNRCSSKFNYYIHSPYPTIGFWKQLKKYVHIIKSMLKICDNYKCKGFIIHLPNMKSDNINLLKGIQILSFINELFKTPIILEYSPYKINQNKLEYISDIFKLSKKYKLKICLDTAHLWVSGFDFTNDVNLSKLKKIINKNRSILKLWHINGSKYALNSGRDTHIIPGNKMDKIWYKNKKSYENLLKYINKNGWPYIHELNKYITKKNINDLLY